jgi:hypothetical protein
VKRILTLILLLMPVGAYAQVTQPASLPVAVDAGPIVPVPVVSPDTDPGGFAGVILDALKSSNWRLLAVLVVILAVWLLRRFGGKAWPWLATDRGGAVCALVMGMAATLAGILAAGGKLSGKALLDGLVLAFSSAGGWALVKKMLAPSDALLKPDPTPAPTPPKP